MKNFTKSNLTMWLLQKLILPLLFIVGGYGALAQLPDLVILDVYWENLNGPDDHIERGDSVVFFMKGKNVGADSTPAGTSIGAQFRVYELDNNWVFYQQAGWAVVKDSFMLVGDTILLVQNEGSGSNGKWVAGPPGNYKVWTYFDDAGGGDCKRICEEDETNNFSTEYFTVYPSESGPENMPDLVVTDLQFVNAAGDTIDPSASDDVLFQAEIKNIGSDTAFSAGDSIEVSFYVDEVNDTNLIASTMAGELFDSLAPGGIAIVTGNLSEGENNGTLAGSWLAVAGDTLIFCEVDADSMVLESSEENNILSKMLYIDVADVDRKPDLVITDIIFDPEMPVEGDTVALSVKVKNIGPTGVATGLGINAIWTGPEGDPISFAAGDNLINDTIPPGSIVTITGNFEGYSGRWLTPGPGSFNIGAVVDQGGVVDESSEDNNGFNKVLNVNALTDLAVVDVSYTAAPDTLEALKDAIFTATVKNVSGIPANTGDTLWMTWNISGFGDIGHDTIILDDPLEVGETVSLTMQETWMAFSGNRQVKASLISSTMEKYTDNDATFDSVFIKKYSGLLPDLEPVDIIWSPENPRQGDTVQISVVVKNTGDTATIAGYGVNAHFHVNGTQVGWVHDTSIYTNSIAVNEEITLPMDRIFAGRYFKYPRYSAGDHTIRATIDRDQKIEEKDDDNNVLEEILTYGPPRLTDLTLTGLTWNPNDPEEGNPVTFSAYLKNIGELDLTDKDTMMIKWMIGEEDIDSMLFTAGLMVGDSVLITGANAWTSVAGDFTVTITADVDSILLESDETNNSIIGNLTVSQTSIGVKEMAAGNLTIYPNPAEDYIRIRYFGTGYQTTNMRITNVLGKLVVDRKLSVMPGRNLIELNIGDLSGGMYFIKIGSDTVRFVVR
jgi:subtilase family serine protease